MSAEVVSIKKDELSPNALLGMLMSKVNDIGCLAFVVHWKNETPEGPISAGFTTGANMSDGALYVKILDHTYNHIFMGEPVKTENPHPSAE